MADAATDVSAGGGGLSLDAAVAKHMQSRGQPEPDAGPADEAAPEAAEAAPDDAPAGEAPAEPETDEAAEAAAEDELSEGDEDLASEDDDEASLSFESFSEIAEAAGMTLDDLMTSVKVPIDGESVSARQLVQRWREGKVHEGDREAVKAERAALDEEREQAVRHWADVQNRANGMIEVVRELAESQMQQVKDRFAGLDWNALRAENPGEFAATSMAYQQSLDAIQQQADSVFARVEESAKAAAEAREQEMTRYREVATKAFRDAFGDEFGDDGTFDAARGRLETYVRDRWKGSTDADVAGIFADARVAIALEESRRYRELMARKPEVLKPKLRPQLRRGPAGVGDTSKARGVKAAKAALRKSGTLEDAVALKLAQRR